MIAHCLLAISCLLIVANPADAGSERRGPLEKASQQRTGLPPTIVEKTLARDGTNLISALFPDPVAPIGDQPWHLASADFNNDGHLDLVVPGYDSSFISLYLGDGNGGFTFHLIPYDFSLALAVGDFDGDSNDDIVTSGGGPLTVFLGNGDGTFRAGTQFPAGEFVYSIAVADLNLDDHEDLVVGHLNSTPENYQVLLGTGDGTFADPVPLDGGNGLASVVSDFDEDGYPDIATTLSPDGILLFFGDGTGGFQHNSHRDRHAVGQTPASIAVADLDGDAHQDLIVGNGDSDDISLLFGNGEGDFTAEQRLVASLAPWDVDVADVNGDALHDIVVSGYLDDRLLVFFGDGTRDFGQPCVIPMAHPPGQSELADYDGDGLVDLAVASSTHNHLSFLRGSADGVFEARGRLDFAAAEQPTAFAVGDFNNDGHVDSAVAGRRSNEVVLLVGDGLGNFAEHSERLPTGQRPSAIAAADFNDDGHLDLIVTNADNHNALLFFGSGDSLFELTATIPFIASPRSVVVEYLNADVVPDLAIAGGAPDSQVTVFLGDGLGGFIRDGSYDVGASAASIVSGDLNEDDRPDLVVINSGSDDVSILFGSSSDELFDAELRIPLAGIPVSAQIADSDGNGTLDLVVANQNGPAFLIPGNGDGTFGEVEEIAELRDARSLVVEDLDKDGVADFSGFPSSSNRAVISWGVKDGTTRDTEFFALPNPGVAADTHDLNHDHRNDLLVLTRDGGLSVFLNGGLDALVFAHGKHTLGWAARPGATQYNVYRGDLAELQDLNQDGRPDVGYGSCQTNRDPDPEDHVFVDEDVPLGNEGFFYLVAYIQSATERGLGTTGDGIARVPGHTCP